MQFPHVGLVAMDVVQTQHTRHVSVNDGEKTLRNDEKHELKDI